MRTSIRETVKIVQLPERMGSTNRWAFKKQIASVIGDSRCLIFDLSRLKRLDSLDLGLIIACLKRQRDLGGDLRVCSLSKQARVLFELVKMHHVLDIFNTPDEAVTSYLASEPQDCDRSALSNSSGVSTRALVLAAD